jgi:hypothetical protein
VIERLELDLPRANTTSLDRPQCVVVMMLLLLLLLLL